MELSYCHPIKLDFVQHFSCKLYLNALEVNNTEGVKRHFQQTYQAERVFLFLQKLGSQMK